MNKTDSRLKALIDVRDGKIKYDALTGTYSGPEGAVSGARRRTFAELKSAGVIEGGAPVTLTESGCVLITNWS